LQSTELVVQVCSDKSRVMLTIPLSREPESQQEYAHRRKPTRTIQRIVVESCVTSTDPEGIEWNAILFSDSRKNSLCLPRSLEVRKDTSPLVLNTLRKVVSCQDRLTRPSAPDNESMSNLLESQPHDHTDTSTSPWKYITLDNAQFLILRSQLVLLEQPHVALLAQPLSPVQPSVRIVQVTAATILKVLIRNPHWHRSNQRSGWKPNQEVRDNRALNLPRTHPIVSHKEMEHACN